MLTKTLKSVLAGTTALAILGGATLPAQASSHREAPYIGGLPRVDGTDFYMFRSYETGREGFVTFIANYIPLQLAYGGPNFFPMDPDANYEIHVDNNGDAVEDLTFRFKFRNEFKGLTVPAGGVNVAVPLINIGGIGANGSATDTGALNLIETYTVEVAAGGRSNASQRATQADGSINFPKATDFIGTKTFGSVANYERYADAHIRNISIPGCSTQGRVFVGQRAEGFYLSLGQVFDLISTQEIRADGTTVPFLPVGEENANRGPNQTDDVNITSIALEVPIACLTNGDPVVGAWTTASLPRARLLQVPGVNGATTPANVGGAFVQVSRLSHPLVNELVIGIPDKDRFNSSQPVNDTQFLRYVTNPSFPILVQALFGPGSGPNVAAVRAPDVYPRTDLVDTFLRGIDLPGLITLRQRNGRPSEMMRLNTSVAPTPRAQQSPLGLLSLSDLAGYPNGRRPADDTVDITLRVAMGALLRAAPAIFAPGVDVATRVPAGQIPFVDGSRQNATNFRATFPYLNTPHAGDITP